MLARLWRRFTRGPDPSRQIAALERRAAAASPQYQGSLYARAAEAARRAGDVDEALRLYGRAINAYLQAGRGRPAELICEKAVKLYPPVVRARYTLALIALGHGDREAALRRVREYAMAALAIDRPQMTVPGLLQLAALAPDTELRRTIAGALRQVEQGVLADRVERGSAAPFEGLSWSRAVAAALKRPDEVDVTVLLRE